MSRREELEFEMDQITKQHSELDDKMDKLVTEWRKLKKEEMLEKVSDFLPSESEPRKYFYFEEGIGYHYVRNLWSVIESLSSIDLHQGSLGNKLKIFSIELHFDDCELISVQSIKYVDINALDTYNLENKITADQYIQFKNLFELSVLEGKDKVDYKHITGVAYVDKEYLSN